MKNCKQIILYGAGNNCIKIIDKLKAYEVEIIKVVDNDSAKHGSVLNGYFVESIGEIKRNTSCIIVVTLQDLNLYSDIKQMLCNEYSINGTRIITYIQLFLDLLYEEDIIQELLNDTVIIHNCHSLFFDCLNGMVMGGVESWTKELVMQLKKRAHSNVFILTNNNVEMFDVPQKIMHNIQGIDIKSHDPFDVQSVTNIIKILKNFLPCIAITALPDALMIASYILNRKYLHCISCISVIHNSTEQSYISQMKFKNCIDLFIATTLSMKKKLSASNNKNVEYITIPFVCSELLNRKYTLNNNNPIKIGYAGRLDGLKGSQKRIDLLFDLILELKTHNIKFIFEIAGDGPAKVDFEKFIANNTLDKCVRLLGRKKRSEMASFWKNQDICVSISDYEGRNISVLEAMGQGVVPVVSATLSRGEDIKNGYNGFIFPCGDYVTACKKIVFLYYNRDEIKKMGERAHDDIFPKSSTDSHVEQWEKIIKKVGYIW